MFQALLLLGANENGAIPHLLPKGLEAPLITGHGANEFPQIGISI